MKRFSTLIAIAAALVAAPLSAQTHQHDHAGGQAAMTEGEVRKVDASAKKITLKHGEIKNLNMPPMTMVFQVKDAAMLGKLKAGDKVRFHVEQQDGAYVVTMIEPKS